MKHKMDMAHEMALEIVKLRPELMAWQIADRAWEYADAMYAEAEKREDKTRPEVLCEVDWSQVPEEYPVTGWYIFNGVAHWISDEFPCGPAPSFGFTGSHIVERPL